MCRLTAQSITTSSSTPTSAKSFSIWPLPVWLVVSIVPLLPSYCFLNRGYTQWCHWVFLAYCLTHSKALCQFICIQSLLINVGWYCTLFTDYYYNGRVGDILFRNMPTILSQYILEASDNISGQDVALQTTLESYLAQIVAFGFDLLLHPLLCYYVWSTCFFKRSMSVAAICSWQMLGAAVVLSRIWSLVHCYHHYQTFDVYYYGPHVYKVPPVYNHLWTAAYVGEAVTVMLLVGYVRTYVRTYDAPCGTCVAANHCDD